MPVLHNPVKSAGRGESRLTVRGGLVACRIGSMAAHGSAATGCSVKGNLMRQLILGLIAVGTLALVIGCGSKQADAPPTSSANNNVTEVKKDNSEKPPVSVGEKLAAPTVEARIEATWDSKLKYYKEPTSAGAKTTTPPSADCAVSGHVRLVLPEKEADGLLTVTLYDCTPQPGPDEPRLNCEWHIEGMMLKHFRTENVADPEYTFVLPWDTYKKDMTKVRIDMKYEPKTGTTLNIQGEVLTLDHSEMKGPTDK